MDLALLDELERQHREAEKLLKALGKAKTAATQQPLVDKFRTKMAQHMRIEEADVYPALQRIDLDMDIEAEVEHDLARKGLQQLVDMVGKPGFGAAVAMVQAGIAHHVQEEEGQVFPKLRKELSHISTKCLTPTHLEELATQHGIEGRSTMSKAELERAILRVARTV